MGVGVGASSSSASQAKKMTIKCRNEGEARWVQSLLKAKATGRWVGGWLWLVCVCVGGWGGWLMWDERSCTFIHTHSYIYPYAGNVETGLALLAQGLTVFVVGKEANGGGGGGGGGGMGEDEASAFACNLVLSTCIKAGAWKEAGEVRALRGGWVDQIGEQDHFIHSNSTHSPTHPPTHLSTTYLPI